VTACRFVNSDFTVDYPAPIQPDTVLVGGFAVDRWPAPLPADLERFMADSGDDGVVVASFGTLVRHYGPRWTSLFTAAFERLPQRVIWRHYGNETSIDDTHDARYDQLHPITHGATGMANVATAIALLGVLWPIMTFAIIFFYLITQPAHAIFLPFYF